jgi:LmbE family N-acetylglucosaminyl deacetylase
MRPPVSLPIRPLIQRTLVLAAHPDDEALGCGALLQCMEQPVVIHATDGAPLNSAFWKHSRTRGGYAALRRAESERALAAIGLRESICLGIADQDLYRTLGSAGLRLLDICHTLRPDAILTHAYEGGHPDHDCCSFLASVLSRETGIPAWEFPLYARHDDALCHQVFLQLNGTEVGFSGDAEIQNRKLVMLAAHASQSDVIMNFDPVAEQFRPQPRYDYSQPPHAGRLNYEAWGWPMRGTDLCSAFNRFELAAQHTA